MSLNDVSNIVNTIETDINFKGHTFAIQAEEYIAKNQIKEAINAHISAAGMCILIFLRLL